jgi:hypothetical protein
MSQWQDHIAQFKELLQTLKQDLTPYWDKVSLKEKEAQLQSIEKTITNMQKSNTSIPDELRELKFKLLKELDAFSEAESIKEEIQGLVAPFLPSGKKQSSKEKKSKRIVKRPRKYEEQTVEIKDLIEVGLLADDAVLTRLYKGAIYKAEITPERKIKLLDHEKKELFDTPSGAAVAASGKSQNGWSWWKVETSGVELIEYRKNYLKQQYEAQGRR